MKAAIVIFPGSNREHDVAMALKRATGQEPVRVWHRDGSLPDADLIVLPGGFAYGDYLRCGAMAAHSPIMRAGRVRRDRWCLQRDAHGLGPDAASRERDRPAPRRHRRAGLLYRPDRRAAVTSASWTDNLASFDCSLRSRSG